MPKINRKEQQQQQQPQLKDDKNAAIPRPLNCFLFYRLEKQKEIVEKCPGANHRVISKIIAKWWKQASDEEKKPYVEMARRAKQEHRKLYPNYKYTPKKKNTPKRMYRRKSKETGFTSSSQENNDFLEQIYDDSISLSDITAPAVQHVKETPAIQTETMPPFVLKSMDYFSYPALPVLESQAQLVSPFPDAYSESSSGSSSGASSPCCPDCHSVAGDSTFYGFNRSVSPFSSLTIHPNSPETVTPGKQEHQQSVDYFQFTPATPPSMIDSIAISTMPINHPQEFCWPEFPVPDTTLQANDYFFMNSFDELYVSPQQEQYPNFAQFIDPSLLLM